MDWLDLPAVQGSLKSLLQHHSSKASVCSFWCAFMYIVLFMFFENGFWFIAKLIKREMLHIYSVPTPPPLPLSTSPTIVAYLWTVDEPALTCPHHPEPIVYIRVHSGCCVFCGPGPTYIDMFLWLWALPVHSFSASPSPPCPWLPLSLLLFP